MASFRHVVLVGLVLGSSNAALAQLRTDALLDACKQKTNVVERVSGKLETVGEKMDELCHGYLVGAYDALIESRSICAPNDPPSPEYLLSILELYLKAEPPRGRNATQVVGSAYRRAFPCKEKKGVSVR